MLDYFTFKYEVDDKIYYKDLENNKYFTTRDYWIEGGCLFLFLLNSIVGWILFSSTFLDLDFKKLDFFHKFIVIFITISIIIHSIYSFLFIFFIIARKIRLISVQKLDLIYLICIAIICILLLPSFSYIFISSKYMNLNNVFLISFTTFNFSIAIISLIGGFIIGIYFASKKIILKI
ncbi:Hypothetical protein KVN_LOCUS348 [uncultured virus]|nr:Hypothetical protein KVN_LOCUS348 [uncultured virus]